MCTTCPATQKSEYYCDTNGQDVRLNNQAVFWCALVSPIVNGIGDKWTQPVGSFILEWQVNFRTARIAAPQRTTFNDCVEWSVDASTSVADLPYNLRYTNGAKPTTQAFVVIPRAIDETISGLERGVVYYGGTQVRDLGSGINEEYTLLYGTLRGAQQLDVNDIIPVDAFGSPAIVDACFYSIGPESGVRGNVNVQPASFSCTTQTSALGTEVCDLVVQDRRFQAGAYMVNYTGISPQDNPVGGLNGVTAYYEDNSGQVGTVVENEQLILKPRVPTALIKSILGLTDAELNNVFGAGSSEKRFLGIFTTVLGFVIRTISVLSTISRIGMAVKREFDVTDTKFLEKVRDMNAPFLSLARSGSHPGHQMLIVANAAPPPAPVTVKGTWERVDVKVTPA